MNDGYLRFGASVLLCLTAAGCGGGEASVGASVIPTIAPPAAPRIGTATPGNGSATIAFAPPPPNGGATITGYTVTCSGGAATITATGTASPITVAGLTNGTPYSCVVAASNAGGTGAASASVTVTPAAPTSETSTASVLCPYSQTTPNITLTAGVVVTSTSSWSCAGGRRTLTGNGVPNHAIGTFPNPGNPNVPVAHTVSFSATLTPSLAAANVGAMQLGYALNGVKFDPGTGGTCPSSATKAADCAAIGQDQWRLEALQSFFNFGIDFNNAHVQPTGVYHYHAMPEGLLTFLSPGISNANPRMVLIGWAPDGAPIYARYGRTVATDGGSPLKIMRSSWAVKATPDAGRPSVANIPLGVFLQDYTYVAGSGDLDDCNGRFDVTPEFPKGIYHYYATDTWPYFPRCWKGPIL